MAASNFEQAVYISASPTSTQEQRQRAFDHLQALEDSEDGWTFCADQLQRCQDLDLTVTFACLKIVEGVISKRYCALVSDQQQSVKELVIMLLMSSSHSPTFIRNKIAQLFGLIFRFDYPYKWKSCFEDLLALLNQGRQAIDMFLRVLTALNDEIADRDLYRSQHEYEVNAQLKDQLRERDVAKLIAACFHITQTYIGDDDLASSALTVVSHYINWVDIGLVANDEAIELFHRCLQHTNSIGQQACECIVAIMLKGMAPEDKMRVIQQIDVWPLLCGLTQQLVQIRAASEDNCDSNTDAVLVTASRCIDAMAFVVLQNLTKCLDQTSAASADLIQEHANVINAVIPTALQLLGHVDDDVAETALPSLQEYLSVAKQFGDVLGQSHLEVLQQLLTTTVVKLKYDLEDVPDNGSEEDALFQEFRKELKGLFGNLCHWNLSLVLESISSNIDDVLSNCPSMPWNEVELCLYLLYALAEYITQITRSQPRSEAGVVHDTYQHLVQAVLHHNVVAYPHLAVVTQVFEVLGRNPKYLANDECAVPLLQAFLGPQGVLSGAPKLRSRCCYLMSGIMRDRQVKPLLAQHLDPIVECLAPVLSFERLIDGDLLPEDQFFLFEGLSWVLAQDSIPSDVKQTRLWHFADPLLQLYKSDFHALDNDSMSAEDERRVAERLCHVIACVMRLSKGFSAKSLLASGCQPLFLSALNDFLSALALPCQRSLIHSSVRMFLHRMIVALGDDVLSCIPAAIKGLLTNHTAEDLQEFIPLINHLITKFKAKVLPFLDQVFIPLIEAIFAFLNQLEAVADNEHVFAELSSLRRGYFTFLHAVVNNGCCAVLTTASSKPHLSAILTTVLRGAAGVEDVRLQKQCFSILVALTTAWAAQNIELYGYETLIQTEIVPACFTVPLAPHFDLHDAQAHLCFGEICALLLLLTCQLKGELLSYLQRDVLTTCGFDSEQTDIVVQSLHQVGHSILGNEVCSLTVAVVNPNPRLSITERKAG
eukprot:m.76373 g.76373  ORF g.76373 m.76373 type:complete len:994 (-) comp14426_c0_seq3:114-3095(-)